jgi:hypothetical protein
MPDAAPVMNMDLRLADLVMMVVFPKRVAAVIVALSLG